MFQQHYTFTCFHHTHNYTSKNTMNTSFLLVPHLFMVPATAALLNVYTYWEKYHYCLHVTSLLWSPSHCLINTYQTINHYHNITSGCYKRLLVSCLHLQLSVQWNWLDLSKIFLLPVSTWRYCSRCNFLNYETRYYNFHNAQLLIYTDSTVTETSWDHNLISCISIPMISNCVCILQRKQKN